MKVTYHKYLCDICECEIEGEAEVFDTQVVFHTEQNEGRPCQPYKSIQKLHLCPTCYRRSLLEVIQAIGVQGNNKYSFREKEEK